MRERESKRERERERERERDRERDLRAFLVVGYFAAFCLDDKPCVCVEGWVRAPHCRTCRCAYMLYIQHAHVAYAHHIRARTHARENCRTGRENPEHKQA